ncbi:MAG: hypothetical protein HXX17_05100 [Geobacteraceae bacterium]|nr:hypothetical protein [Geobacteraceae bacterium]
MKRRTCFHTLVVVTLILTFATSSLAFESGYIDGDGIVRLADALLALRHVAGTERLDFFEVFNCDVAGGGGPLPSKDGVCDIFDALIILAKAQGQITF